MQVIRPNNLIIKLIITSFFVNAGWGLITPIYAIFVTDEIAGGSLEVVGIAVGIFWLVKAVSQPFLAYKMDVVKGEHDDMVFLLRGTLIATIIPLFYILSFDVWHIFILEAIRGFGFAMVQPTLSGVFTRHVDKNWEAYAWGLQSASLGFAFGFSAIFGSMIASFLGFNTLFVIISFTSFISLLVTYLAIRSDPWLKDGWEDD